MDVLVVSESDRLEDMNIELELFDNFLHNKANYYC